VFLSVTEIEFTFCLDGVDVFKKVGA
jgi:hypothetical protein